jgi:Protein of unknown function (DUF2950)
MSVPIYEGGALHAQGSPRSPLGPLVAFATEEGITIKPDVAQPFYGYYFRRLENQGADAKGVAERYLVNGKMTGGFAYVAIPRSTTIRASRRSSSISTALQ